MAQTRQVSLPASVLAMQAGSHNLPNSDLRRVRTVDQDLARAIMMCPLRSRRRWRYRPINQVAL